MSEVNNDPLKMGRLTDEVMVTRDINLGYCAQSGVKWDSTREQRTRWSAYYYGHMDYKNLPEKLIPAALFGTYPEDKVSIDYPLFVAKGFLYCTEALMNILRDFDIGETTFHETRIFEFDRVTPVAGRYFFINFDGIRCEGVSLEHSILRKNEYKKDGSEFLIKGSLKSGSIALNKTGIPVLDWWADTRVLNLCFWSKRLCEAVLDAGIELPITFEKCRVLSGDG